MSSNNEGIRSYKADFKGQKTRARLSTPLRLSDLHAKLRRSFFITREFDLLIQYADEDGDAITVSTDEDLKMAESVFTSMRKKIMLFSIKALKKSAMPAGMYVTMYAKLPRDSITDPTKERRPDQEQARSNDLKNSLNHSSIHVPILIAYPSSTA